MKIKCPKCQYEIDPREALEDDEWRAIINLMPAFGGQGRLVFEYVEKFGIAPLKIKGKKLLRLIEDMARLFGYGKFHYQKKLYEISVAGIVTALEVVNNKNFETPLETHNYLKKIMIGISEEENKKRSQEAERALRKKEDLLLAGVRPDEATERREMPAGVKKEIDKILGRG